MEGSFRLSKYGKCSSKYVHPKDLQAEELAGFISLEPYSELREEWIRLTYYKSVYWNATATAGLELVSLNLWCNIKIKHHQTNASCMPNSRSSGQPLLPINPKPQLIGRMEAQRDIERRAAQQEQARLDVLAAAQVHQQNIDNPGRATDRDEEDLGDDELLNPRRDAEVARLANRRDRQARFRPERRAMQIPFDDDDDDLDGAGATGAIIPPPLAPGAKFNITSTMIPLLQLKGLFSGLAGDDPNIHLINFISTFKSFDNPGIGQNAIRLCLFPLSLSSKSTLWLNGLTPDSITN
ncbi:hypothetical protein CQW23_23993 [Capsicum baccatum]|uniref:Uncharacterized protein n=1 Tax=Capsicum baccatum TaxID=33114 RepID=A0A2G2VTL9_CAPBA|nr:hypothetical protein CQW23_23993 [Capsicum baccatum]